MKQTGVQAMLPKGGDAKSGKIALDATLRNVRASVLLSPQTYIAFRGGSIRCKSHEQMLLMDAALWARKSTHVRPEKLATGEAHLHVATSRCMEDLSSCSPLSTVNCSPWNTLGYKHW